ncbi:type-2 ice-structuring protein-like [Hemibagrus wyckioides]|uniref:type-2 ice-structuring protein-like n=1 Tax=Hemibagrus wyckioides TaxID=337641 RepID=UPI00266C7D6C|nr:type-2 ice-structuring protein-like [Hemibagrus wyckioides]
MCPIGWMMYGKRCFRYQATSMNWESAEKHCQSLGGHLVSIHNENEYQLVKFLIGVHELKQKPTWIGLSGCQQNFKWVWSDDTKVAFTKWNPAEPNRMFGECCVNINSGIKKDWSDMHCIMKYPFVCAKEFE